MPEILHKDVDGHDLVGKTVIDEIRSEIEELMDVPWYGCRICGFKYDPGDAIKRRVFIDAEYCHYVKRIVKKSIITHISSHFIYDNVQTLSLGIDENDVPIARGEEYYLKADMDFFRGLNIAVLYSLYEDAIDRILVDRYCRDVLSEQYRKAVKRCNVIIMNRYRRRVDWHAPPALRGTMCAALTEAVPEERNKQHQEATSEFSIHPQKRYKKVYLKPWKDPESLFCDREFLEKLVGKEIADGDECRDASKE